MASLDSLVHQVIQVSLGSLVSLAYQEGRVTLDSQALGFQDPLELKGSQVFLVNQEPLVDRADQEWTDFLGSRDFLDPRVSLASDFLVPQVCQGYLDLKASLDLREILVSLAALVHQDDPDLMGLRDQKVTPVHLADLELPVLLDPPPLAHWGPLVLLDNKARWDHQDSLEQMEQRETPALQV